MANKISTPGVVRKEIVLDEVVSPAGTSTGAIVGGATQGRVNARVLASTDKKFLEEFGKPQPSWTNDFGIYGALQYLQESNALYFTRVTTGGEGYAGLKTSAASTSAISANGFTTLTTTAQHTSAYTVANTSTSIKDIDDATESGALLINYIAPGTNGNNVAVRITTSAAYTVAGLSANVDWRERYDDRTFVLSAGAKWHDVFRIDVYTRASSGADAPTSASTPVETWYGSSGDLLAPNGSQLNIESVVNGNSKYIYLNNGLANGDVPYTTSNGDVVLLSNGTDGVEATAANTVLGWTKFYNDRERVDINILMGTFMSDTVGVQGIDAVCNARKDCIGTVQTGLLSTTIDASTIIAGDKAGYVGQSYIAKYAGWDQVFDAYNDKKVFIPKSIFGAVLMARTDRIANTWNAPAGVNRGILPVLGQNVRFTNAEIGQLYDRNINTSKFIKGVGNTMWGQRTALFKTSSLREIAVRRMLLFIENSIEPSLTPFLFEPNNDATRLRVEDVVTNFLNTVVAGGGIEEFNVVANDDNNTAQDIANNILNVDIYVLPTRTIEFIQMNVIVTRSGVSLTEV